MSVIWILYHRGGSCAKQLSRGTTTLIISTYNLQYYIIQRPLANQVCRVRGCLLKVNVYRNGYQNTDGGLYGGGTLDQIETIMNWGWRCVRTDPELLIICFGPKISAKSHPTSKLRHLHTEAAKYTPHFPTHCDNFFNSLHTGSNIFTGFFLSLLS